MKVLITGTASGIGKGCAELFLKENHEVYVRNPVKAYRDSNIMPSVGAFPLKPTENDLQALQMNSIKIHLESCIQRLLNSDLKYIEEYGFKKLSS